MKVIVYISHDRHREDIINVYSYNVENIAKIKTEMEKRWPDGEFGYFGDLPSEGGEQYGCNEFYYDSYAVVEVNK